MSGTPVAICARCQYCHFRSPEILFDPSDLQTPGVLKTQIEWEQQEQVRRLMEMQLFESGKAFEYEPHYYAWCAAFIPSCDLVERAGTGDEIALSELAKSGNARMNPVTGELIQIYALCARMNPSGKCQRFEAKVD